MYRRYGKFDLQFDWDDVNAGGPGCWLIVEQETGEVVERSKTASNQMRDRMRNRTRQMNEQATGSSEA